MQSVLEEKAKRKTRRRVGARTSVNSEKRVSRKKRFSMTNLRAKRKWEAHSAHSEALRRGKTEKHHRFFKGKWKEPMGNSFARRLIPRGNPALDAGSRGKFLQEKERASMPGRDGLRGRPTRREKKTLWGGSSMWDNAQKGPKQGGERNAPSHDEEENFRMA